MKPKFETGDRVIYKPCKLNGSVINRYRITGICAVVLDEDGISHYINENDLEFENPKLAFLTRLQELLATFDAEIGVCLDYTATEEAMVLLNGKIVAAGRTITAENIFDYDND